MLKQISVLALGALFLFCATSLSFAEYAKVKAIGSVETKFTKSATTGQKKLALEDAKKKALDKYLAGLDSQRLRIINNFKDELYKNINVYVPEIVSLNDGRWENGYWNIDVEASINEAQIEELVNKYAQSNMKKKEEVYLSFVFVAREVEGVKEFMGEKNEKVAENNAYKENIGVNEKAIVATNEKASMATNEKASVAANEKVEQNEKKKPGIISKGSSEEVKYQGEATSKYQGEGTAQYQGEGTSKYQGNVADTKNNVYEKTTSGSIDKKSEVVRYRSYSPEEIEAKVTEVFNKADFTVVPTFEAGINKDKFIKDFSGGDDITDATKKETVDLTKTKGINLIAVAMLDVGREQIDPATGLSKIYVNVMGYILDSRGKFTKKIASVGPLQYSGLGENPKVAKVNALVSASTSAAKDLVDQLRAKEGL
jgi:translation initiation factor 2 beta subunit (eIF-2beta)/eIF-5